MQRYTLTITSEAKSLIDDQVYYISHDSISNAIAWERRLKAALYRIADAPGHAVDEMLSEEAGITMRKYVFEGTYIVHYRVDEERLTVEVMNFRHGARMPGMG